MIKRFAAVLMSALLLCGCADTPKTGKPGKTDSNSQQAVTYTVIPASESDPELLYDSCGVTVRVKELNKDELLLEASNTNSQKVTLRSLYIEVDGLAGETDIYRNLKSGETHDIGLSIGDSFGSARTRLYLVGEDFNIIEGSLSDVITLKLSDTKTLRADPLCTPVYEDDSVKLGMSGVRYLNNTNSVYIELFGINKTDKDLYVRALVHSCNHEDYSASCAGFIPRNGKADLLMSAFTTNDTISGADLDSINYDLYLTSAEDAMSDSYSGPPAAEGLTLYLPKTGRPENKVPDRIISAPSPDEYLEDTLSEDDRLLSAIRRPSVYDNGSVSIEYVAASAEHHDRGITARLFFKCTNRLDKQIRLEASGVVNRANADYFVDSSVKAMYEKYIEVSYDLPESGILGEPTWAAVKFNIRYDDGHDDTPMIGTTDYLTVQFSEELYDPQPPADAHLIFEDDNCALYLVNIDKPRSAVKLELFAVNKLAEDILVSLDFPDGEYWMYSSLKMLPQSCSDVSVPVYSSEGKELTVEEFSGKGVEVSVYDFGVTAIAAGEGTL